MMNKEKHTLDLRKKKYHPRIIKGKKDKGSQP